MQFEFYADQLQYGDRFGTANCFLSAQDSVAVAHARYYLNLFPPKQRVYRTLLDAASRRAKDVNFNRDFKDSEKGVLNSVTVPGAFTKDGWGFVSAALDDLRPYLKGEGWVLGSAAATAPADLGQELRQQYQRDYINRWVNFVKATSVLSYRNLSDAANKLEALSGNRSPLMELFWVVSQNTAGNDPGVRQAFQPASAVVPADQAQYVGPKNQAYLGALLTLKASLQQLARAPADDSLLRQVEGDAAAAEKSTDQLSQEFDPNSPVDQTVKALLLAPIQKVEGAMPKPGEQANAAARPFCAQFDALVRKSPFNPDAQTPASLESLNAVFQTESGALWVLYNQALKGLLTKQGERYTPLLTGAATPNPAFVRFFNWAAQISDGLYPQGSATPRLEDTLQCGNTPGIRNVTLNIDGQTLRCPGSNTPVRFAWPGSGQGVHIVLNGEAFTLGCDGIWGVFQFFATAQRFDPSGSGYLVEWPLSQQTTFGGRVITSQAGSARLQLRLNMGKVPPVFQKRYLRSVPCVPRVVG